METATVGSLRTVGEGGMRRVFAFGASACVIVGLAGCWPASGQGPDRRAHNEVETGFAVDTVDGFTELWTGTTDQLGPRGVGPPVVSTDGGVYATTTRSVYAFEATTGAPRWVSTPHASTPNAEVDTEVIVLASQLYASVRLSDGRWEMAICQLSTGFCDTLAGELQARMEAIREGPDRLQVLVSQFASVAGGGTVQRGWAYLGAQNVLLTDQPNAARLTLGVTQFFHAGIGVGTAPANGVRAFPTAGGSGWATPIDGADATSPVLSADGTTVYVGTDAGTVYALAAADGAVLWSAPVGSAVTAAPALAGDTLYVPTASGSLVALSATGCGAATCTPSWSTAAGSKITVQPAVAAGVVFTGSADGAVRAYDAAGCAAATCTPSWSDATGSRITGAPAISLGKLFVGTQDGRLIAYGLPPTS